MRILILGGDGYLGWPTAMHLSAKGHEIAVADNYLRRRICFEENIAPLFETPTLAKRISLWKTLSGHEIKLFIGNLTQWDFVTEVFNQFKPDCIVHYAEQPSAPYSMMNRQSASLTLQNNLSVTANIIFAVREFNPSAHIIKLGTMGEYGTPNIDIEEGWLDVEHKGRKERFLYPRQAGSLYHTTKIMDTDLLWFYVRTWNLRVTDLMQGPVYGLFTNENQNYDQLLPFFNYDELFGTVLNRFIVQAVAEYPLTVYGQGGQTRGYLNLEDTLNCIYIAVNNPPSPGRLQIFNQFTEVFSVNQLADRVTQVGKRLNLKVEIQSIKNPRKEAETHYYNPKYTGLKNLGLQPNFLTDNTIGELMEFVIKHKSNIYKEQIFRNVEWK